MEIVELMLRVEEEFGVTIEDEEIEHFTTPGAVCNLIERKLGFASAEAEKVSFCPTSRAFYLVRRELMQQNIERRHITPAASLESLWPRFSRREQWHSLATALDISLPPLERSPEWAFVALLPLGIFPAVLGLSPVALLSLITAYIVLWKIGAHATQPFAVHIPKQWQTVGELSRHLALRSFPENAQERPEIWPLLSRIIADEFDLPLEKVTRDANFVRDLGLG